MARYVAFLGSINVGGNRLSMADLRHALEREDFEEVETVVASGNVLFEHEDRPTQGLSEKLEYIIRDRFGFESVAAVRSREELEAAIAENPFAGENDDKFVHVLFLEEQPSPEQFEQLIGDYAGRGEERMAPGTLALHIDYGSGVAGSKLTGDFIERRLRTRGTARNLNSLARIVQKMAED